jgi:hypothetical protein
MFRDLVATLAPAFAVSLPMLMGLGLLYFYIAGVIGMTTALVGAFALAAIVVTGLAFRPDPDDQPDVLISSIRD